jgi:hypothetical protein
VLDCLIIMVLVIKSGMTRVYGFRVKPGMTKRVEAGMTRVYGFRVKPGMTKRLEAGMTKRIKPGMTHPLALPCLIAVAITAILKQILC